MANEPIGKLRACPFGLAHPHMEVRRKQKGGGSCPLYLWSAQTGPVFLNTREGQDWILERAVMFGDDGSDPEPPPADPPADPPAEDPPAEDPPAEDPPAEDPPAEDPPAEDPDPELEPEPADPKGGWFI